MKLVTRISSIRRIAWKALRSWSDDSAVMCADSEASSALSGWIRSPRVLEHRGDRVLGEPVDLEVGMELAQLVGDGRRRAARARARSGRRCTGRAARAPSARVQVVVVRPVVAVVARPRAIDEVAEQQVDLDRVAGVGEVARPLEDDERAVRQLREPRTRCARPDVVVAAVDHEDRAVDPGQQRPHVRLVLQPGRQLGGDERRAVRLEPPADGVLVRLRRVRLGQALREEELEEVLVVLGPVVAVVLPPAVVRRRAAPGTPASTRDRGHGGRPAAEPER